MNDISLGSDIYMEPRMLPMWSSVINGELGYREA